MKTLLFAVAASAVLSTPAFAAELITNGGFETGTFAGWSSNVQGGSNGNRFIDTPGTSTPASGFGTAANGAGGNFYAVTDQGGGGAYSLTQLFTVASGTTSAILTFQMFAQNQSGGGVIVNPAGLNFLAGANQHARVDILTAGASAFTNAPGDIVANLYLGADGSGVQPFQNYSFNLLGLGLTAGNSYQIRFGQVDNQFFFQQGVDNVSITTASVPEPANWALMIAGFGLVGGAMRKTNGRRSTSVRFAV